MPRKAITVDTSGIDYAQFHEFGRRMKPTIQEYGRAMMVAARAGMTMKVLLGKFFEGDPEFRALDAMQWKWPLFYINYSRRPFDWAFDEALTEEEHHG